MTIDFENVEPLEISVAVPAADIDLRAHHEPTARVHASGEGADGVSAELIDGRLLVQWTPADRRHSTKNLHIAITAPAMSSLRVNSGSGDLTAIGPWAGARLTVTSGDLELVHAAGPVEVTAGSGDIEIERVEGILRVKSGSGDVRIGGCADLEVSAGSGDVVITDVMRSGSIATGSGDVVVRGVAGTVAVAAASGDIGIDTFSAGALDVSTTSGDVNLGVVTGIPVWAELHSRGGDVTNRMPSAGSPSDGQHHLELRVRTGSGDITIDPTTIDPSTIYPRFHTDQEV